MKKNTGKIILSFIEIALIVLWVVILLPGTSMLFIYILLGLLAVLIIGARLINALTGKNAGYDVTGKMPESERPEVSEKSKQQGRIAGPVFGAVMSVLVALANYGVFGARFTNKVLVLGSAMVALAGGFFVFFELFKWTLKKIPENGIKNAGGNSQKSERKLRSAIIFAVVVGCTIIIDVLVLTLGFLPGLVSVDSINQIDQVFSGVYSNHHPFYHTMIIKLCLWAGQMMFGSVNAGVTVYCILQIILLACTFGYVVMTLYQTGLNKWIVLASGAFFVLMPYNIFYSFTMWKDVLFGAGVAVLVTALLRCMRGIGSFVFNLLLIGLGSVSTCIMRSNGWLAFLILFVVSFFVFWKKFRQIFLVMAAALVVAVTLKYTVLNALNVSSPDVLESLAIPIQQIARVLADGGELTDEQNEILSNVINPQVLKENYTWDTVDSIKPLIREQGNVDYITENKAEMIKLYVGIGIANPVKYVEAWVDATKGFWNGGYGMWNWTGITENSHGIEPNIVSENFSEFMKGYAQCFNDIFLLNPFVSMGLSSWIIAGLFLCLILKRRREAVLFIPCIALVLTLMVATPISNEFRYAYASFTCLPLLIVTAFTGGEKQSLKEADNPE